jgi:S-adenosylmethionine:tRNA ribosyltransferase-isomerase
VGTTTVRTLESLPQNWQDLEGDYSANTKLYIYPDRKDFNYRFTDAMMTNFHLPESTLLAMVAKLPGVGLDNLMQWYEQAIALEYRFYSYGDAMLIL